MVLPEDVVLVPVTELPAQIREQMQADETDYAVTRRGSRTPSRVVDAQSAELLREFREAKTIVEAVIRYCLAHKLDPERTLEEAYPMIGHLIGSRFLLPADSSEAERIKQSLEPEAGVGDSEVVECVQILEDTELYRCRLGDQFAALKILRPGCGREYERMLDREAAILTKLDGGVAPKLLGEGRHDDRRYLLIEWCPGIDASSAAADLRQFQDSVGRSKLLDLCCAILKAYAALHARGVIHSDIHPRNILVSGENAVKIIDYGVSRMDGLPEPLAHAHRAGVGFFFEPEFARTIRTNHRPPRSNILGEQYSLGALIYSLLAGNYPQKFSIEREEMMRQIEQDPPLPFDRQGAPAWPGVEQVLARALSKDPQARFESISAFAAALEHAPTDVVEAPTSGVSAVNGSDSTLHEYVDAFLDRIGPASALMAAGLTEAPTASVGYGAAGLAYALYRIACATSEPAHLATAEIWLSRAAREINNDEAFHNAALEMTPDVVGQVSPLHAAPGIFSVEALLSQARGDLISQQAAIDGFAALSQAPCDNLDATLGRCGTMLAAAMLLETIPAESQLDTTLLRAVGDDVMGGLWEKLDSYGPVSECPELRYSGVAHGWAGMLYATMRWCRITGQSLPATLETRIEQLAELAEPVGRGARWPWVIPAKGHRSQVSYMPGWCNGSAGFVYFWTLAHEHLRHERYLSLAHRAAWNAWESSSPVANLCCGIAGQSYALLNLFKHTGEHEWLQRARELAIRAVTLARDPQAPRQTANDGAGLREESLYKGGLGVAILAAELAAPRAACMPFFESEG
jgi:serine/threonine protein kinase